MRRGPGVDQPGGQAKRVGRGRVETEPAGVGGQGDEGGPGNRRRKRHAQLVGRLDHQPAGRLGLGVLEQLGAQVVAAEVMIDDDLDGPAVADHVRHRAELGPGAGVENDQDLAVGQVLGRTSTASCASFRCGSNGCKFRGTANALHTRTSFPSASSIAAIANSQPNASPSGRTCVVSTNR